MIGEKIFYQIGDPRTGDFKVLSQTGLSYSIQPTAKTQFADSPFFDGDAWLNGFDPDFKGRYQMSVNMSFANDEEFTINDLHKLLQSAPKIIYFYELDLDGRPTNWYFNYAKIVQIPEIRKKDKETQGVDRRDYSFSLALYAPFFFKCQNALLKYFSPETWQPIKWGTGYKFGDPIKYGQGESSAFPSFSSLSELQLQTVTGCDSIIAVSYKDRFLAQSLPGVGSENLFTYTLTTNTLTTVSTTDLDLQTNADSRIYLIQFDQLNANETIQIINTDNNSGILITWLGTASWGRDIVFNSYKGRFYDAINGLAIPLNLVSYDVPSSCDELLYFNALATKNPYLTTTAQTLNLIKNTSGNNQIIIDTLQTNHN